jgi:very-short-patch-repair endonuclease
MPNINIKIEVWKKRLLDLGKRNRLINFKETKRSNVTIVTPNYNQLFDLVVTGEKALKFPYAKKIKIDDDGEEFYDAVVDGDLETKQTLSELQKTLKVLRAKAKMSIEEQGINTLYLAFGLLRWTESDISTQVITSPIILVPVSLSIESISSPYILQLHEDEIIVNPTLTFKLENDFGIKLPDFDSNETKIGNYLKSITKIIENENWEVVGDVNLTLLSFLKINMYKDLERNEERITNNQIISAIAGESDAISFPSEYNNYDHDKFIHPIDTFQVVDADSSQQDAILLSKNHVSFVLQGPPGTGKSQTITNIISEALADGKKVLFVSEKMAALQVVHKRLEQVGLSNFCLTLHSHKANKKEILKDLANTLNMTRTIVKEEALYQLNILQNKRDKLNEYHTELHTVSQPLGKTIYETNGILASLNHVPEVIFEIKNVDQTTPDQLNDRKYLLDEFSKTVGKMSEDFTSNVWYNAAIDSVTYELRHDIDANLKVLIPQMLDLANTYKGDIELFDLNILPTLNHVDDLIEILRISGKSPQVPYHWISEENIANLIIQAEEYQRISDEYQNILENLSNSYQERAFELDAKLLKNELLENIGILNKSLNEKTYRNNSEIVTNIDNIYVEALLLSASLKKIKETITDLSTALEIYEPEAFSSISNFYNLLKLLIQRPRPTEVWFDKTKESTLTSLIIETKSTYNEILDLKSEILNHYDKEVLNIDYNSILIKFRTDYHSIFRIFNSQYRNDKKQIQGFAIHSNKITDSSIIELLSKIKSLAEKTEWIENNTNTLNDYFGTYFKTNDTNWDQLNNHIIIFQAISEHFQKSSFPTKLKAILLNDSLQIEEIENTIIVLSTLEKDKIIERLILLTNEYVNNQSNITKSLKCIESILSFGNAVKDNYESFASLSQKQFSYDKIVSDLTSLSRLQEISLVMDNQKETLEQQFSFLWNGISTNWNIIINTLTFAGKLKELVEIYNLPNHFVEKICKDTETVELAKVKADELSTLRELTASRYNWYINLFDESENFSNINLYSIIDRMDNCLNRKSQLEEWIDYRRNRKACIEAGLNDYIEKIEQLLIKADLITPTYLKRFYRLWLDTVTVRFTAVNSFRRKAHEENIREFKELDNNQLIIARSRVKERLLSRLPDFNSATSSRDEIGVLKRELNKQRKLLPLRKLFNAIPNLLTSLKPCFMMSPLSVSVFLEAQSYDFDTIIFDEASQVCTEDAIGAIMRGKQVIIVGDNKQLPPTNFFASTLSDNDFDTDNDDDFEDEGAYESILDEALNVIPERSLRWHYRSRHEHLIAFSNAKIYNHSLVTFPSQNEKKTDFGVEYVYVSNGIYDRGGKKNNINEAHKVADLVFEHFAKYPNRSLGVVTFSEAQQLTIDMAIRQLRLSDNRFDNLFSEEKEEPFFIKNLENVQGDERDTIIFSIGYAKDSKGTMYMNFGPLSRDGGYRRLNVAITRAKFNVKLVGSIQPTDIDLDRTNSEGVKMLRSYIDFAKNGPSVLENEIIIPTSIELESPFEESVYDFLSLRGFNVATQVGCSGFRIDMAVRHPKHSGVFVLGIECDGATYHSSRTARERDRLRQTILEDIGWKIYRIWSTDWIKDTVTEGNKLIEAVEKALSSFNEPSIDFGSRKPIEMKQTNEFDESIEKQVIESSELNTGFGFSIYEEANIWDVERIYPDSLFVCNVIKHIINIEQPIHYENLCKRIAPIFGNQKATSKIRESVDYYIDKNIKHELSRIDDFLSLKTNNRIEVKIPNSEGVIRPIRYISKEELGEAMISITNQSYGIKTDDLLVTAARAFGFNRTGGNINQAMQAAYLYLLENKKITEIDDRKVVVL